MVHQLTAECSGEPHDQHALKHAYFLSEKPLMSGRGPADRWRLHPEEEEGHTEEPDASHSLGRSSLVLSFVLLSNGAEVEMLKVEVLEVEVLGYCGWSAVVVRPVG